MALPTPQATRLRNAVDNAVGGAPYYGFAPWHSALLFNLTGEAAYGQYAVQEMDAWVVSEEALISSNQRAMVAGDSYLEVGDIIGGLALTYDWCFDLLTPAQRSRWLAYADQAVWNVWHHETAVWNGQPFPWSGWSVNNPSNNYYYSFLRATMLLGLAARGELASADGWVDMFRQQKMEQELIPLFARDLTGGGSREGTGYGMAHRGLFELYAIWEASTDERLEDRTPHAADSLLYLMHATAPTLDRVAPIGDHARDSTAELFDYHRAYMELLLSMYPQHQAAAQAQHWLNNNSVPQMSQYFMYPVDFVWFDPARPQASSLDALYPAYHAVGVGNVFVRSGWSADDAWLTLMAGPFTESHAHHDQGSFTLYRREWLAYDQNINSHSGLVQQEQGHNLVYVDDNGTVVPQRAERQPAALYLLEDEPAYTALGVDITPIYDGDARVTLQQREMVFIKPDALVVFDRLQIATTARAVFNLQLPQAPVLAGPTASLTGAASSLQLTSVMPGLALTAVDWAAADPDMNAGWRVASQSAAGDQVFMLHVLSLDGAVTNTQVDNGPGMNGVALTMASNRSVTVRFSTTGRGLELLLTNNGSTVHTGAVPLAVETLPVFQ